MKQPSLLVAFSRIILLSEVERKFPIFSDRSSEETEKNDCLIFSLNKV